MILFLSKSHTARLSQPFRKVVHFLGTTVMIVFNLCIPLLFILFMLYIGELLLIRLK